MDDFEIISLTPDDWQQYKALRLEALQHDPSAFGSTYAEKVDQSEEYWREGLTTSKGMKLFARVDGGLVGMAGSFYEQDGQGTDIARIINVYVKPDYRGRGISRALIERLLELIRQEKKVATALLEVYQNSAAAIATYKKLGFKENGSFPDFVASDGRHIPYYRMTLKL
jgi:ribosomal protein S18 acetylase RimI-like enzyme